MKLPRSRFLDVELVTSHTDKVHVGRLALDRSGAVFEYDAAFVESGREINPLQTRPRAGRRHQANRLARFMTPLWRGFPLPVGERFFPICEAALGCNHELERTVDELTEGRGHYVAGIYRP